MRETEDRLARRILTSAISWGLTREELIEAIKYTHTRDLAIHFETLDEMCEAYTLQITDPIILIIGGTDFGVYFDSCDIPSNLEIVRPHIYFPRELETNLSALRGFYAHEFSHLVLLSHPKHQALINMEKKIKYTSLLGLIPAIFNVKFRYHKLNYEVEAMVDQHACEYGFGEEIRSVREVWPLEKINPRVRIHIYTSGKQIIT